MANTETVVHAYQDLTLAANAAAAETVVIGGKTYTLQSALTNVDGNVLIGASAEATIDNLVAAINLGDGAGTAYAAAMTRNEKAWAKKQSASVLRAYAAIPGSIGNDVPVSETLAAVGSAWGAATMANGSGNILAWVETLVTMNQLNSEVLSEIAKLTAVAD